MIPWITNDLKPNTPIETLAYQDWLNRNQPTPRALYEKQDNPYSPIQRGDYDTAAAWRAGLERDPQTQHFPDTYKLPWHSTFSDESKYYKPGMSAVHWTKGDNNIPAGTKYPDWDSYARRAQVYLKRTNWKGTSITGQDLANAAKATYEATGKHIPLELALAQAQRETKMGTIGRNPKTNPYNVGEFDNGTKMRFPNKQAGISAYYNLIAKDYLNKGVGDLIKNFVNKKGQRYASDRGYESYLQQQIPFIQKYINARSK